MAAANKDTIYIDVDDEITAIIDKVRSSSGSIVALVLPKRASVLQSIVNMKLLKRAAGESKKNIVLVTSEASLMPLAGAVGLHVAKTPQSKPEIPVAPSNDYDREETINEDETMDIDAAPVVAGAAAGAGVAGLAKAKASASDDGVETLELDNGDPDDKVIAPPAAALGATGAKKVKKNKKLAVPNFERFRLLLVGGAALLLLLIGGIVYATTALPEAQVSIQTDATSLNVRSNLTLDTKAQEVDTEEGIVPAKLVQQAKTSTQQAPATGQKNNGEQARGEVIITNCSQDNDPITVPAGTGISANGLTYITQEEAEIELSGRRSNGSCSSVGGATTATVEVLAQVGGAKYNVSDGTAFTVSGFSDVKVAADGDVDGGTDVIVKIVSQADIDAAKQKLAADGAVKQELLRQLEDTGYFGFVETYAGGTPVVTTSVQAGTAADNVSVTQVTTFTMYGAKAADVNKVIDKNASSQIDTKKQSILDRGLEDAEYVVGENTGTSVQLNLQSVVTAGPDLDVNDIKKQIAGQKSGEVKSQLQAVPGVTEVQVKLSPFFVTSVPKKLDKITITIAEPAVAPDAGNTDTNNGDDGNN